MIKKRQRKSSWKKKGRALLFAFTLGCFLWMNAGGKGLAATANVVAGEGRIRQSADKSSSTLASVKKGDQLDVLSQTTDQQGYTWYKVRIDADNTGYIRADLVTVTGSVGTESASSSGTGQSTEKPQESTQTVVAVTVSETDVVSIKATTQARIRQGAGTNFDSAGGVNPGSVMAVSGMSTGNDGKIWYQVSYSDNNKTMEGFIREDLVEIIERAEVEPVVQEETPVVEESYEERPEDQDYYLKQMTNDNGEADWYLFNNIEGTSMSLTQMLSVFDQIKNKELQVEGQVGTLKIVVYILAGLLIAAIVAVTVLIFKLRDAYEYVEEDEEDEEIEEIEEEITFSEPESASVKKAEKGGISLLRKEGTKRESQRRESVRKEEINMEEQETLGLKTEKADNRAWQSKDFLELDDDMEFEFLDL